MPKTRIKIKTHCERKIGVWKWLLWIAVIAIVIDAAVKTPL